LGAVNGISGRSTESVVHRRVGAESGTAGVFFA
jgi:hypothetical protein